MPNGFITEYEVSYNSTDSSQPLTRLSTGLETSFTTNSDLEMGTEFIFSVRASTQVGAGETASVVVSTLTRPRKDIFLNCTCSYIIYPITAAVQGVIVSSLNSTSVNVSWDVLIILDFPIDKYTVIYSQLSQQQNGREMSAEFLPPATSGVINDLRTTDVYQFQVIATVTVNGSPLEGERSTPVNFTRPGKIIMDSLLKVGHV